MSSILKRKGLSGRESGVKSSLSQGLGYTAEQLIDRSLVTLANVHQCSIYELRQSLKHRGFFMEDYEGLINTETLTQKMVELLLIDKEESEALYLKSVEEKRITANALVSGDGEIETLKDKLLRQKAERKADAVARSAERMASKGSQYFKEKQELNVEGLAKKEEKLNEVQKVDGDGNMKSTNSVRELQEIMQNVAVGQGEGEGSEENKIIDVPAPDPFALKYRSKIGGKYA